MKPLLQLNNTLAHTYTLTHTYSMIRLIIFKPL